MGSITLPKVITPQVIAAVEGNMRRCWEELHQAEQRHAPADVIERLYQAYLRAYAAFHEASERLAKGG